MISTAYLMAVDVIVRTLGKTPLPAGISTAEAGDWVLSVNNGATPSGVDGHALGPWQLAARNTRVFAHALLSPVGGMIGGMAESAFIAQMADLGAEVPE